MQTTTAKNKNNILTYLFLCCAGILVVPFMVSCGKSAVSAATGSNIQLQVLNLSPDLLPVNVYVGYIKRSATNYSYPAASGYFSIAADTPIQIRSSSAAISTTNWVTVHDTLKPNVKYTLFVTGFRADSTITSIFTTDVAAASTVGRGKIRFVNSSPRSPGLDVTANGTPAFSNIAYKKVSPFIEVPPGNYEFRITAAGASSSFSYKLPNIPVQDGKIYTLYSYGVVGRVDSAGFGAAVLSNK
jgi:hypothetical protein